MVRFSENRTQAARAADRYEQLGFEYVDDRTGFLMDLTAADGVNGNHPIDWDKLLNAPNFDFAHDCSGIQGHMNRETGRLVGCFVPRCARIDEPDDYETRVQAYEREGMTRSDAQGVVDAELMQER